MKNKKCVYLLVGPRGSGKSYYAQRLLTGQSELLLISRDEILLREFGSTDTFAYGGAWQHAYALEVLHNSLRSLLQTRPVVKIILDCCTKNSKERISLVQKLREYGANQVVALYFVTPREIVNLWFWLKPGIAKIEEMGARREENLVYFPADVPLHNYDAFHQFARRIDSEGFDKVVRIDPRTELITLD